jgi:hypothetical protein
MVSKVEPLVLSSTLHFVLRLSVEGRLRPEGSEVEGFIPNMTNIKIMKTMFRKFRMSRKFRMFSSR